MKNTNWKKVLITVLLAIMAIALFGASLYLLAPVFTSLSKAVIFFLQVGALWVFYKGIDIASNFLIKGMDKLKKKN